MSTLAAVLLTTGCAAVIPGRAAVRPAGDVTTTAAGPETSGETTAAEPCTDITYSDPTIAFEASLADGDELSVGDTGWIHADGDAADVGITGDPGTVKLSDRSAPTQIACGEVVSSVSWIQVTARRPGTAVLSVSQDPADTISLTVR